MAEDKEQKDVAINVTGVSMSGEADIFHMSGHEVLNEHSRPIKSNQEESTGEKTTDSE